MEDTTREGAQKFILNDGGYFQGSVANGEVPEEFADYRHKVGDIYICDECSEKATAEEGVKTVVYHLR